MKLRLKVPVSIMKLLWLLLLLEMVLLICCGYLLYNSKTNTVQHEGSYPPIRMVKQLIEPTGNNQTSEDPPKSTVPSKPCKKRIAIFRKAPGFKRLIEFKDLDDRFDEARRQTPSETPVTAHFFCPEHQCDIELITTLEPNVLRQCDGVILNIASMVNTSFQNAALKEVTNRTKWFLFACEAAARYQLFQRDFNTLSYQISMTYHSESEIVHPFSQYILNEPMNNEPKNWSEDKTKLVAWMASNCNDVPWPRMSYVKHLQELLPIDIYGRCGTLNCGEKDISIPNSAHIGCMEAMAKYKFYLALENTECDEYITEKFWDNSLLAGSVPIVYGGRKSAYERVAPPHSFIHISDFNSSEKLAEYIRYLDKNDDKYNEYFAWRYKGHLKHFFVPLNVSNLMCRMVPWMNDDPVPFRTVKDTEMFKSCLHRPMWGPRIMTFDRWVPWT
ncbi:4-galactosyl-N-acetylglucosaminide 3-alpha-L-fucosyltransferase FUT6-like [Asterias amurensis]|uniref:4-galactosyl-N-acetylglucosaminide 3-alpha-L-fucosyltransferase FUT6-like n=1 Tax=Asterias amurensis TaxID=7602 RepID=UPI003AB27943